MVYFSEIGIKSLKVHFLRFRQPPPIWATVLVQRGGFVEEDLLPR